MLEEILDEEYPKDIELKDGSSATVRLLTREDTKALYQFFQEIPPEDRLFLRDDVSDKSVIEGWLEHMDFDIVIPIVAEAKGKFVSSCSLHRERRGWMSHIGKVRLVVHPDYRRRGLAMAMMQELINIALHTGSIEQLNAECMDTQKGAIWMCENAGFVQRAVLPRQVRDLGGDFHDLIILGYALRDQEYHALD